MSHRWAPYPGSASHVFQWNGIETMRFIPPNLSGKSASYTYWNRPVRLSYQAGHTRFIQYEIIMKSVGNRYDIGMESVWNQYAIGMKSLWNRYEIDMRSVLIGMRSVWGSYYCAVTRMMAGWAASSGYNRYEIGMNVNPVCYRYEGGFIPIKSVWSRLHTDNIPMRFIPI